MLTRLIGACGFGRIERIMCAGESDTEKEENGVEYSLNSDSKERYFLIRRRHEFVDALKTNCDVAESRD